jgi:hypothetical protein
VHDVRKRDTGGDSPAVDDLLLAHAENLRPDSSGRFPARASELAPARGRGRLRVACDQRDVGVLTSLLVASIAQESMRMGPTGRRADRTWLTSYAESSRPRR